MIRPDRDRKPPRIVASGSARRAGGRIGPASGRAAAPRWRLHASTRPVRRFDQRRFCDALLREDSCHSVW